MSYCIRIFVKRIFPTIRQKDPSILLQSTAAAGQELPSIRSTTTSPCYKERSSTPLSNEKQSSTAADAQHLEATGSSSYIDKNSTVPYYEKGFPESFETSFTSALSNHDIEVKYKSQNVALIFSVGHPTWVRICG